MIDFTPGADQAPDLEKLETALTLARTSREFNRKRAEVLDDRLHRIRAILTEDEEPLYTTAEVAELQASEAELVAAPLRSRIEELEAENERLFQALVKVRTEREEQDAELRRRESAFKVLEGRFERLLATLDETEDKNAEVATEARRGLLARDHLLAAATTRVRTANEILSAPRVQKAAEEIVTSKGAILADAITNAVAALNA